MKKVILILTSILLSFLINAQEQVCREIVTVVRPNISEAQRSILDGISDHFKKEGYDLTAKDLRNYARGETYGSGFVYLNPSDHKLYILTTLDIIRPTQTASVDFILNGKSIKTFSQCKIIAADPANNLALIALPDDASISKTQTISERTPGNGDIVFSASFRGQYSEPLLQISKGAVINNNAPAPEWLSTNENSIQHSASIGTGKPGGPLFIMKSEANQECEIVGMNTRKSFDNQDTSFAIRASTLLRFVENHTPANRSNTKDSLLSQVNKFLSIRKNGYYDIIPFVSSDFIERMTIKDYLVAYDRSGTTTQKEVLDRIIEMQPLEGIRILISKIIYEINGIPDLSDINIQTISDRTATVAFCKGSKSILTTWVFDQGIWKISDFSTIHFRDNTVLKTNSLFNLKHLTITNEYIFNTQDNGRFSSLNWGVLNQYSRYSFGFALGKMTGLEADCGIHRVLTIDKASFIPYVSGSYDFLFGKDKALDSKLYYGLSLGYKAGIDVLYRLSRKNDKCVALSLFYGERSCVISFTESSNSFQSYGLSLSLFY